MVSRLVKQGGIWGVGATMISQRPADINKKVLSQVDILTVLRMCHPLDIAAATDWIKSEVSPEFAREVGRCCRRCRWVRRLCARRRTRERDVVSQEEGAEPMKRGTQRSMHCGCGRQSLPMECVRPATRFGGRMRSISADCERWFWSGTASVAASAGLPAGTSVRSPFIIGSLEDRSCTR